MEYRRAFVPGGTYFFTIVTYQRQKLFVDQTHVNLLRESIRTVLKKHPFRIEASVILPEHLHFIWTLPPEDSDFSNRIRLIKSNFTRSLKDKPRIIRPPSRIKKAEQAIWQRRFWEHLIRDEKDFINHVEYIHFNPLKHGLVVSANDWQHSSFHNYVRKGFYARYWCTSDNFDLGNIGME